MLLSSGWGSLIVLGNGKADWTAFVIIYFTG
jgi:hypothetical protein